LLVTELNQSQLIDHSEMLIEPIKDFWF
jgi:hypothetical protein